MRKWASQVASAVKNLPANGADVGDGFSPWVRKIPGEGNGNPLHYSFLEKEMATHSTILSWRIPWTEEPGGL